MTMTSDKKCKTCTYFPCLHPQCSIGNKEGCDDYKSTVQKEIERIDNMKKNKEKIEPLDWEEIIGNIGNPVWDNKKESWRVLYGYKRINDSFYVFFTDSTSWILYEGIELYLERID